MAQRNICKYDEFGVNTISYVVKEYRYFYQPCVGKGDLIARVRECLVCNRVSNQSRCFQFCDTFESVLPPIYGGISSLSALCCMGVFLTYLGLPRLRRSGYSSKVFLYR